MERKLFLPDAAAVCDQTINTRQCQGGRGDFVRIGTDVYGAIRVLPPTTKIPRFFCKEKGSATCQTGVLYNRCGMLSLWGGALKTDKNGQKRTKTDIGAPQNTAGFAQQQN
ncbi:MAG: hypothetical protein IKC65_02320, partial [Lentisphaeria bacterium]|nr:hypothetical protein [Lentisphaeria bacterium]